MKKWSPYKVYLLYSGATAFLFTLTFTVSGIYRIQTANLNPLQLVLVGTVLEASCFLFEIPTGIIADLYSRRLSIVIGLALIGCGFLLEGSMPLVSTILAAQVLWGVGYTFLSGADEAWLADELKEEELDKVYLQAAQVRQISSFAGIVVSAALGMIILRLPIVLSGLAFIALAVVISTVMPETSFIPAEFEERQTWRKMIAAFRRGLDSIKKKNILKVLLAISLIYGLYSEGLDRLWQAHFLKTFSLSKISYIQPVIWFGAITAFSKIFSIFGVGYVRKRLSHSGELGNAWVLLALNSLLVVGIITFGVATNFTLALVANLASYVIRVVNYPLYRAWLNKNIETGMRATVLSTFGQIDALGQMIGGPIIGYVAFKVSIPMGIVTSGILLSSVLLLYFRVALRTRAQS